MTRRFWETLVVRESCFSQGKKKGAFFAFGQVIASPWSTLGIRPHLSRPSVSYRKSLQQLTRWAEPTTV